LSLHCSRTAKTPDFLRKFPIDSLSEAIKRDFSGVVGESGVLKWAFFIAVIAACFCLQPETTLNKELPSLSK
jgi:hypothetical protein